MNLMCILCFSLFAMSLSPPNLWGSDAEEEEICRKTKLFIPSAIHLDGASLEEGVIKNLKQIMPSELGEWEEDVFDLRVSTFFEIFKIPLLYSDLAQFSERVYDMIQWRLKGIEAITAEYSQGKKNTLKEKEARFLHLNNMSQQVLEQKFPKKIQRAKRIGEFLQKMDTMVQDYSGRVTEALKKLQMDSLVNLTKIIRGDRQPLVNFLENILANYYAEFHVFRKEAQTLTTYYKIDNPKESFYYKLRVDNVALYQYIIRIFKESDIFSETIDKYHSTFFKNGQNLEEGIGAQTNSTGHRKRRKKVVRRPGKGFKRNTKQQRGMVHSRKKVTPEKVSTPSQEDYCESFISTYTPPQNSENLKKDYRNREVKKKVKTRGTPDPSRMATSVQKTESVEIKSPIIIRNPENLASLRKNSPLEFKVYQEMLLELVKDNPEHFQKLYLVGVVGSHPTFELVKKDDEKIRWGVSKKGRHIPQNHNFRYYYLTPFRVLGLLEK